MPAPELDLAERVSDIARQASEAILDIYHSDFSVASKADASPVTAADVAADRIIRDALQAITPEIPVFSEESATAPWNERQNRRRCWLVDPLDGTREFVKRNGEFTVNIALIEDHAPVFGLVYAPVTAVCYYAGRNGGAFKTVAGDATLPHKRIHTRRADGRHIVVSGSRSHGGPKERALRAALGDAAEWLAVGSSLKFCLVAEGKADIYPRFGPTCEWDTAAAHCIVNEAGGRVLDLRRRPLRYNNKRSMLNPEFVAIGDPDFAWSSFLRQV